MRKVGVVLGVAMLAASGSSPLAQSDAEISCRDIGLGGLVSQWLTLGMTEDNILAFCDGYGDMQREVTALRTELNRTRAQLPPDGSVLLVDHPDGCPIGWMDMAAEDPTKFAARVAVAAVKSSTTYDYRATGGDEEVTLTSDHMPEHTHQLRHRIYAGHGDEDKLKNSISGDTHDIRSHDMPETLPAGKGEAFNIMPPYIPLYFCKRTNE